MKLSSYLFAARVVTACNEDVRLCNEAVTAGSFTVLDDGALCVPYGQYPQRGMLHPDDAKRARAMGHQVSTKGEATIIQVVDIQAANEMAADLNGIISRALRGFKAVPVYEGHPYHPNPERRKDYPDRRAYGWIKEVTPDATLGGIRLGVDYTTLGTKAVNEGWFAFHSPQWDMRITEITREGIFARPYRLHSGGLTNEPNIPVPPIVAANEASPEIPEPQTENPTPMKPELKAKLMKLLGLADETDDAAFEEAANGYFDKMLAEKDKPAEEAKPDEEKAKTDAAAAAANAAVSAANEAVLNLRNTRIDFALDQLVASGRVTPANVPAEKAKLIACANEADLTAAIDKLRAVKPTLQTNLTHAANIAGQKGELLAANDASQKSRERQDAVDAVMKERPGISQSIAWGMAASRNPKLFT